MTTIVPVVAANFLYTNGGQITYATTTTLSIAPIQCRDSTNVFDINVGGLFGTSPVSTTLNFAINGLNGLDTGSLSTSKFYFIYAIASQAGNLLPGFIASLSSTAPLLPFGYGVQRLIGMWNTDGSSLLIPATVVGTGNERKHVYDSDIAILNNGAAQTLTTIGTLTGIVPAINNTPVTIDVDFSPATASDTVSFTSGGLAGTVLAHVSGSVATKNNSGQLEVIAKIVSSVPVILYINSAASGATDVWVNSFKYFL
jgi:hypothetical protein